MVASKRAIIKALVLRRLRRRLKRKKRSTDIRPIFFNRLVSGESILVRELKNDQYYHHRYFRMSKPTFDELLSKIEESVSTGKTHSRPISKLEKMAVTLRYLATGNSQISLAMSYRISPSAVGKILRETMMALCSTLEADCLPVPTLETWTSIEKDFASDWNFPNCCGAIDGKHVRTRAPDHSGSMNYNYKGFFSIVLMALVDAKYRFVLVDIGACGSQSDGGVLSRSAIGQALENETLQFPAEKLVGESLLPHVIVGDDAFPLRKNLMKPYPGRGLTVPRRIFNYRMSRARMVSENAFGILAARWRIFHTMICGDMDLVKLIVRSCVLLHNFLINKKDSCNITGDSLDGNEVVFGSWRKEASPYLPGIRIQGSNNHAMSAASVRDKFMEYFNGHGAVQWQNSML